jgi:hypothetical protein
MGEMMQTRYSISPGYGISSVRQVQPYRGKFSVKSLFNQQSNYQVNNGKTNNEQ